jgi:hypothetical protein
VRGRNAPPPSDLEIETKKPAADCSARVNQLVSMMSFCRCFARRVKAYVELKKPAADCPARAEPNSFR